MEGEWTVIAGFPNYSINRAGEIKTNKTKLIRKHFINMHGYKMVSIADEHGRWKNKLIHRLIAKTYIPNPNNHPVVNHKDGIKTNNNIDNLEWCTVSENVKHAHVNGLFPRDHGCIKHKKIDQYDKEDNLIKQFDSLKDACNEVNVKMSALSMCLVGKNKTCGGFKWKYAEELAE